MKSKVIKQSQLTSDCFLIQFWSLSACKDCEYRNTNECGGEEIRAALLKGESYGPIGISGLPDQEKA